MWTRRQVLQSSLLAVGSSVPVFVARSAEKASVSKEQPVLVVIQLDGGNDALNTVIPFADPLYAKLRPTLKVDSKSVVKLSDSVGMHPSLRRLDALLQNGNLAVLPGVSYPNPNRSHFESMAIWHTSRFDAEERKGYGWLGRALDPARATSYVVGASVPGAVRGSRSTAVSLRRIEDVLLTDPDTVACSVGGESPDDLLSFVRRQSVDAQSTGQALAKLAADNSSGYPESGLGERLKLTARLLKANLGARVFYTNQGGYDTHAGQAFTHSQLLAEFAGAVAAFFADLKSAKLDERVVLLAFSEFGRTIKENGSAGTDHGTTGAVFLVGPRVKGGLVGKMPSLADLSGGEPKMTTDFRRIYATLLTDWLGLPGQAALGGTFERLPLLST